MALSALSSESNSKTKEVDFPLWAHRPSRWAGGGSGLAPPARAPGASARAERPLSWQFLCTLVAITLHYVHMSVFAWTFVESLHVYRMLTEPRNVDAGPMRFYYVVGWGIPAIVTGEDVGGPAGDRSPRGTRVTSPAPEPASGRPAPHTTWPPLPSVPSPAEEAPALHTRPRTRV